MEDCKEVVVCVLLFCFYFTVVGQNDVVGTLEKSYDSLFTELNNVNRSIDKKNYANIVINKAKEDSNRDMLIAGYHTQAILYNDQTMLAYCDSIIALTKTSSDTYYPRNAYKLKGDYFFNNKNYSKSLDNYLEASFYADQHNNLEYILQSKYDIGTLKRRINEKNEALSIFKEVLQMSLKTSVEIDSITVLLTITSIANIYNDLEQPDSSYYYNNMGYKKAIKFNEERFAKHFSLNQGVTQYFKKQYERAIDSLEKHTPYFENIPNTNNLPYAYYYAGKSHQKLGNVKIAINYFKKVDSLFVDNHNVYNISRKSYDELIKHFKGENELKNQLYYINQLIKVDSLLHEEELYLSKGIYKEYDIPQLKSEKAEIQKQMLQSDSLFKKAIAIGLILLVVTLLVLIYQYRKRISDKKSLML